MKISKIAMCIVCLCSILTLACSTDEITEKVPDEPKTDEPDPGKPEPGDPEPGEPEPQVILYERDFTTEIDLKDYQMINADGIEINNPIYTGNWYQSPYGGSISLSSYLYDTANQHDHWLITEGFYIDKPKVIIAWHMVAEYRDESYEVYLSTSPDKNSFTDKIFAGELPRWTPEMEKNDKGRVEYLLDGYKGKTIYVAFRHNTPVNKGFLLTLKKLTITSFSHDKEDLATNKIWLTYPDFLPSGKNSDTGTTYPPNTQLNVSMEVKNLGTEIRNGELELTYKYGEKEISETAKGVYLPHDGTFVHTFSQPLLLAAESPNNNSPLLTATVRSLPGEIRVDNNTSHIELTLLNRDPKYRMLFEKLSKLNCVPCGQVFYSFDQLNEAYPERMIGVCTMYDAGLGISSTFAGSYHSMIASIGQSPGTPAGCYDRIGPAFPELEKLQSIMKNGIFASRMFPPFAIDVTHDFSEDGATMYIHVSATCLIDQENVNLNLTAFVLEDNIKEYPNQTGVSNAVHNHIIRDILGEDWRLGVANVIPAKAKAGEIYTRTFEYAVPSTYGKHTTDRTQLYAVGSIIDPTDGEIINSNKSSKITSNTNK